MRLYFLLKQPRVFLNAYDKELTWKKNIFAEYKYLTNVRHSNFLTTQSFLRY